MLRRGRCRCWYSYSAVVRRAPIKPNSTHTHTHMHTHPPPNYTTSSPQRLQVAEGIAHKLVSFPAYRLGEANENLGS
jgi:hypothetical protein